MDKMNIFLSSFLSFFPAKSPKWICSRAIRIFWKIISACVFLFTQDSHLRKISHTVCVYVNLFLRVMSTFSSCPYLQYRSDYALKAEKHLTRNRSNIEEEGGERENWARKNTSHAFDLNDRLKMEPHISWQENSHLSRHKYKKMWGLTSSF